MTGIRPQFFQEAPGLQIKIGVSLRDSDMKYIIQICISKKIITKYEFISHLLVLLGKPISFTIEAPPPPLAHKNGYNPTELF